MGALWSSGNRTKRSSPNRPANMLPFTNADRLPNIGRRVAAGWSGTSLVTATLACSLGLAIMPGLILLTSALGRIYRGSVATRQTMVAVSRSRHRKTGFTLPSRMSEQPPNLDDTPIEPLYTHPSSPFLRTESTAPAHVEMPTPGAFQSALVTYRSQIEFGLTLLASLVVLLRAVTVLIASPDPR